MAELLFGKEILREELKRMHAPSAGPMVCRNNKRQGSQGKDIGTSAKFCDEFKPMITDVGLCMTKDSIYKVNSLDMKINHETVAKKPLRQSLRFAETTIFVSNGVVFGTNLENPFRVFQSHEHTQYRYFIVKRPTALTAAAAS